MRTRIDYSNDSSFDAWSVEVTIISKDCENDLHSLAEYIKENAVFEINCCYCPWDDEENEYGDNFTCDKDIATKSEFMKEVRRLVKEWKQQNNN